MDRWPITPGNGYFRKFNSRIFTIRKIIGLNRKTSYTISIQITIFKGIWVIPFEGDSREKSHNDGRIYDAAAVHLLSSLSFRFGAEYRIPA